MKIWEVIQECNKEQFLQAINNMSSAQFSQFCQQYMDLRHFYDTNRSAWATEDASIVSRYPEQFWPLNQLDIEE